MSLTDEQIEQCQEHLSAWRSVTCRPMASHVVEFARAIESAATAPLLERIKELERELEALRKDAERYEVVKQLRWSQLQEIKTRTALALSAGGETFDDCIDAMKEPK